MFASDEKWDLYKKALELRTELRIFQEETSIEKLKTHIEEEKKAFGM